MRPQLFSMILLLGFMGERFLLSYQFSYVVALLALVKLMLRPRKHHIVAIIALTGIAMISDLGVIPIEVRYIAFLLMFLVLTQFWECDPRYLFGFQVAFLLLSLASPNAPVERFVFGAAVSAMVLMIYMQRKPRILLRYAFERFLFVISLFLPFVGYGSRAALMIWLAINWRAAIIAVPVAILSAGFLAQSVFLEIPVLSKVFESLNEISAAAETDESVSLRGLENYTFVLWLADAPAWQIVLGSGFQEALPGSIIGNQFEDFAYIPHNYLFGVFFQFGVLGSFIVIWCFYHVIRRISSDFEVRILVLILMLIGAVVKHGTFDTDLIMVLAAIRFIEQHSFKTAQIKNKPFRARTASSRP